MIINPKIGKGLEDHCRKPLPSTWPSRATGVVERLEMETKKIFIQIQAH
jgi:hypothetical protein